MIQKILTKYNFLKKYINSKDVENFFTRKRKHAEIQPEEQVTYYIYREKHLKKLIINRSYDGDQIFIAYIYKKP